MRPRGAMTFVWRARHRVTGPRHGPEEVGSTHAARRPPGERIRRRARRPGVFLAPSTWHLSAQTASPAVRRCARPPRCTPIPMYSRLPARDALIADIARRVRPAVPEMPQDDFDQLVARMADLELRHRAATEAGILALLTDPRGNPIIRPRP